MGGYELAEDAEIHVAEIYEYSIAQFGLDVARRYLNGLHEVFGLLADNPRMGTDQSQTKSGYRRYAQEPHVV